MSCSTLPPGIVPLAPSARQVLLSVNPKAGARSGRPRVDQLTAQLHSQGYQVRDCTSLEELRQASAELLARGLLRAVVAAGGDGTVRLVADQTPAGVPIAVLPLGTENLLSKYLGLPADPAELGRIIDRGWTVRLDAGQANDRLFLLMAGVGFDAEVVRRLHATRTGHIRHWSYIKPIVDSIRSYEYPPVRVYCEPPQSEMCDDADEKGRWPRQLGGVPQVAPGEVAQGYVSGRMEQTPSTRAPSTRAPSTRAPSTREDRSRPIEARWVFAVNLPRYAGGLRFAPEAVGTDGLLDVCTFRQGSLTNGLRYLFGVTLGMHLAWRDCEIVRAARVTMLSDAPVPYQLDGDPAGHLPLEVKVLPDRLTLLVGDPWLRRLPAPS